MQAFGQRHYWAAELGSVLCLGLSTVRFRGNKDSVHEVYVDDEQLAWFEQQLESSAGRPVFVFTHAPPLGCGLKVVEVCPAQSLLPTASLASGSTRAPLTCGRSEHPSSLGSMFGRNEVSFQTGCHRVSRAGNRLWCRLCT